jgi:hypothetical protein
VTTRPIAFGPYATRTPISRMPRHQCAYCARQLWDVPDRARSRTKDHVLSRKLGSVPNNVRNLRPCCYECNTLRNELGQCVGALMLAVIEGHARQVGKRQAALALGMLPTFQEIVELSYDRQRKRQAGRFLRSYLAA